MTGRSALSFGRSARADAGHTTLLATRSTHKAREIKQILAAVADVHLVTLDEVGLAPDPDEDGIECFHTFRQNAHAKARYFQERTGLPTIADDSGIVVPALGGDPGVRSKRFAGRSDLDGVALDHANNDALLAALRALPEQPRDAFFLCTAVYHHRDHDRAYDGAVDEAVTQTAACLGSIAGRILQEPSGEHGFGYDPLFFVPTLGCTLAQVDAATKNRLSHRGRAFRALAAFLASR